jgi:dTDP-4-dehydrorhamnose 3,5-epimerase
MQISPTAIPDVVVIEPPAFADSRGRFSVVWNAERMAAAGLPQTVVQVNESWSAKAGTVRGLHYQAPPFAQAKLVRVLQGRVLDVAVDFRRGSPSFGRWVGVELSAENRLMLNVPRGFLHGFVTREPNTVVGYFVDNAYHQPSEGSIRFDDPTLAIDWGIDPAEAVLSEKDAAAPLFDAVESPFVHEERIHGETA